MKKPPIELSLKQKIYLYAIIAFLIVTIGVNVGLLAYKNQHPSEFLIYVNDVDRYENGNTALRVGEFSTTIKIAMGQERKNCYSAIVEVDSNGKIVWEYTPKNPAQSHIDHEIKKREFKERMGYFYTDCLQDRIVFVDYQTQEITWDYWLGDINWTALNSSWDKKHYYNQPDILDWSHLNDIDFHNYSDWESMLLSIRDFNLIVEVNLTSAQNRTSAHEDDIIWWYGGDGILACPHNPDYLPNGNIIIVDSNNRRFIEVNMSSSEIVWEWNQSNIITWPRDCDLMPDGEHYLITDCDKTFILNKNTK
ncbi:MAG: hypothetical protein BAJALOKI3v1_900002 [Promethearchaeota archaeon]|nr:MAG: hypothetical protein BAJALOKI3v1_900002 [Candidatus Lokiarchaeota archaeon]